MRYLYWRGNSLWSRFPVAGKPPAYPLKIRTTGSPTDKARCERLGERMLAEIRTGRFFDKFESTAPYRPKYWRLVARFWYHEFKFLQCAYSEWHHIVWSLREFGKKFYDEINVEDVRKWINAMKEVGVKTNCINKRLYYLGRVYRHAGKETDKRFLLNYNPSKDVKKLKGDTERTDLLTPEMFERNYEALLSINDEFAFYYLLLWETGRRPLEVALYRLEYLNWERQEINVPASISKTKDAETIPLSKRAWGQITLRHRPGDTGLISKTSTGTPWLYYADTKRKSLVNNSKRWMKKLRKVVGKTGWMRDTRGGFVTEMCQAKIDLCVVGDLSGHKDLRSVKRYDKRPLNRLHTAIDERPQPPAQKQQPEGKILEFRRKAV